MSMCRSALAFLARSIDGPTIFSIFSAGGTRRLQKSRYPRDMTQLQIHAQMQTDAEIFKAQRVGGEVALRG